MNESLRKLAGSKPAPGDLVLVQAFINSAERETGKDMLATADGLKQWLVDAGLAPASAKVTDADVRQAIDLREALRELALTNNGGPSNPDALDALNRAARSAQLAAHFEPDGSAKLAPLAPGIDGALGHILAVAFDAMTEGSWRRLKACADDHCAWAFYDETKNRSGTWCAMNVCGNRNKARLYRRRHALADAHAHAAVHARRPARRS